MKPLFVNLCLVVMLLAFVYACVDQGWTYYPSERRM
jgi:hypothetical protein